MKMATCILFAFILLVGNAIGAGYILPKGQTIYTSQFQMESSASLSKEAFSGWFNDQIKTGQITFAPTDIPVAIIDECSWCSGYAVRVSATNGNFKGWVYKEHLKKEILPAAERMQTTKSTTVETGRDGLFVVHKNGTVLDTKTNLLWAAKDNGANINWQGAKSYCENYRGGGYTNWRMPTQDELAELYARAAHKDKIELLGGGVWASETRGSEAALFFFGNGSRLSSPRSYDYSTRALPVRSGK